MTPSWTQRFLHTENYFETISTFFWVYLNKNVTFQFRFFISWPECSKIKFPVLEINKQLTRFNETYLKTASCYFSYVWLLGWLESPRLSDSVVSSLGIWKRGLLLILCHPKCMNPIKGTITIRTLYSLQRFWKLIIVCWHQHTYEKITFKGKKLKLSQTQNINGLKSCLQTQTVYCTSIKFSYGLQRWLSS